MWASGGERLWEPGTVKRKTAVGDSFDIEVSLDVGGKQVYTVSGRDEDDNQHLKLRNVAGQSSVIEGHNVADLTSLTYLHEPAILYSLKERYAKNTIYTYTGPILLAVNPFKTVNLYTDKLLEAYKVRGCVFFVFIGPAANSVVSVCMWEWRYSIYYHLVIAAHLVVSRAFGTVSIVNT